MGLKEAIQDYREKETGAVSLYKNPCAHSCDNLLLFTSLYMILLNDQGEIQKEDTDWYQGMLVKFSRMPGLLCRYPGDFTDTESHDDTTGVAVACSLFGLVYRMDIFAWAIDHGWSFNVPSPNEWTLQSFLARIPDFSPTIEACASVPISFFSEILFCVGITWNALFAKKSDTSGIMLSWLKCRAMKGHSAMTSMAVYFWKWRSKRKYAGGIKSVFEVYFGKYHPFSVWGPDVF